LASSFNDVRVKAWEREIELVVYDPATNPDGLGNPNLDLKKDEVLGYVVSSLHTEFKVKRSRTFSENTAEFKVYNANAEHRARMTAPGMRVRFSAGYKDSGGPLAIFWGTVTAGARSEKKGTDWVTTLPCISSLSEALGTEGVVVAAKNAKTPQDKQDIQTRQINRIPVSFGYAPGHPIRQVLWDIQAITGLAVYGAEALPTETLKNGFNYSGGVRGAIDLFKKTCLIPAGWTLYIDNQSLIVYPVDEKAKYTVTTAHLTVEGYEKNGVIAPVSTGYITHTDKTKANIPPKMVKGKDGKLHRVDIPRTYEVKCLLNPKLAPNTLATIEVPGLDTTLLIDSVEFEGNNYGGNFQASFEGHVYEGSK
jgi:hypothetical protein